MAQIERDACGIGFVADAGGTASRSLVEAAIAGLANVKHRGAVAADSLSGDGAGVLLPIPAGLFGEGVGVANLFVRGPEPREALEALAREEGLDPTGWRVPETDDSVLGSIAAASRPGMVQLLFTGPGDDTDEIRAYRLRRRISRTFAHVYPASCSFRTIVYKGLAAADRLGDFYADLSDERMVADFVIFHQRFSTNTLPTWERAQPFRMLCHNGEINTIEGNQNRMNARSVLGTEAVGLGAEELFHPLFDTGQSDSAKLDSALELLVHAGRDPRHAMAMLIPDAWENLPDLDPDLRGFFAYHSALMEPWDGPAGVIFTDGRSVGAALDRNGLRPMRWEICEDGLVVCCSEVGAVDVSGRGEVRRGRLGPGQMIHVVPGGTIQLENEVKAHVASLGPYARWSTDGFIPTGVGEPELEVPFDLEHRQAVHGYTRDELAMIVRPMYTDAKEPTFSMGDDSPLPPMAGWPRPVSHFLRQRFAQVTNPPIDPIREGFVMSLRTLLGPRLPILSEGVEAANLVELPTFFLYPSAVAELTDEARSPFPCVTLDMTFPVAEGAEGLERAVRRMASEAVAAVEQGAGLLVLDDGEETSERVPVPSLLATGAVHHALIEAELRTATSLVVVADDTRDVHGFACLLGYGADAICPRLALQSVTAAVDEGEDSTLLSPEAQARYRAAVEAGVLKILSKMGISTVDSYRGAQIFEVIGLDPEVVDVCFRGSANQVGGLGWSELGRDCISRHEAAAPETTGFYRVRARGEYHTKNKEVVGALNELTLTAPSRANRSEDRAATEVAAAHLLQRAIAADDDGHYAAFARLIHERPPTELNDLLDFRPAGPPVPLDEVEPATEIVRRFSTGAMSHGALSREAHETLTRAMNLIGALSNCGEGGEAPERFATRGMGRDDTNSRIKQVASGRFGVTPQYLAHADELNIKMAQGSKPGEGGQLPGHKVSEEIARLRYTQPGVTLISPPPHHDIYSIEDLAQLVYDLKQVNGAQVSVKLVAEDGVGTIAAGVVKCLADVVHISGHNGGTGASPLSSIKHAGMAWELGLAQTQAQLVENQLRDRVRLRVDGGFMTGRHVMIAALLGADEYSFGTVAMIAEGCIMLRACHRDTCKPGVATQRPHLRANFSGTPEGVAAYFMFLAEEVRQMLAELGLRSLQEAIGRTELLTRRSTGDPRVDSLDLTVLTTPPPEGPRSFSARVSQQDPRSDLGDRLRDEAFRSLWEGDDIELSYEITNADRAVGAALGGAVALEFGARPPRGSVTARFTGSAGQSFGAFIAPGIELHLTGDANDYVGKGMAGGRISVTPPPDDAGWRSGEPPALIGNTCLYGATGGDLFVAGTAGERFAVRNSGAVAVVEGVGDHCCEYMTGGTVVVLGSVGYNFGAGMTGGEAFVFEVPGDGLLARLNTDLIEAMRPQAPDVEELLWLIERHHELTGSPRTRDILADWETSLSRMWHIVPRSTAARIRRQTADRVSVLD